MRALLVLLPALLLSGSAVAQPLEPPRPPERMHHRIGATVNLGYTLGWMFGVPISYGEAQVEVGWTGQKGPVGIDVGGMISLARGSTEAGRTINQLVFGPRAIFRYELLRFGIGVGVGQIGVRRSTRPDDPQTSLTIDSFLSAGFEPIQWDGHALFLEVQGHLIDGTKPATTFAAGFRF